VPPRGCCSYNCGMIPAVYGFPPVLLNCMLLRRSMVLAVVFCIEKLVVYAEAVLFTSSIWGVVMDCALWLLRPPPIVPDRSGPNESPLWLFISLL
jgi:hypothetical protein